MKCRPEEFLSQIMKYCLSIILLCVTTGLPMGCLHTDTAIVRSSRPSMAAYGRTTKPTEAQVLDLVTAERAADVGDYAEAIRMFEELLSENPTLTDAYLGLGDIHFFQGNFEAAETNYSRAARLEPRNFDAQYGHATVLAALNRYSQAVRAYQRALAIQPTSVYANIGVADSYLASKRPQSAITYAQSAVKLEPENIDARLSLATAFEYVGRYEDAVRELEVALELGDTNEALLFRVVAAYMKAKRWQEAANAAETLVKVAPSASAYERLGRAYFRLARYEMSMDAYRQAVEMDPRHWPSLNGLGVNALNAWLRSERSDTAMALEARDAFYASLRINPDQPKLVEILATYSL